MQDKWAYDGCSSKDFKIYDAASLQESCINDDETSFVHFVVVCGSGCLHVH